MSQHILSYLENKATRESLPFYYNGKTNWTKWLSEAYHFNTYPDAEYFLKNAIEVDGWGGLIQIEKYFTGV